MSLPKYKPPPHTRMKQRVVKPRVVEEPDETEFDRSVELEMLLRQRAILDARDKFMSFVKFTSPDPEDPNDVTRSRYFNARHHDAIARVLEEVEKGDIQQLILTMPPRHGKSELTTRRLPAWLAGRNPREGVIVATYSDTFAEDFGREVRTIMNSSQFHQVFPEVRLAKGSAAANRLQTIQGGTLVFVGAGGALTGRGAHCFVSGTKVLSAYGDKQIQEIRPGDEVLSYDQDRRAFCFRHVQAIARRAGARVFRIATARGRVVEATGDHPFFVDGRWVEAAQLTVGDRLLCGVRQDPRAAGVRDAKAHSARPRSSFLLARLLGGGGEHQKVRAPSLCALWRARAQEKLLGRAQDTAHLLFGNVHARRAAGGVRAAGACAVSAMRALQRHVHSFEQQRAFLWSRLCLSGARGANGGARQPALARWSGGQSSEAACHTALSGDAAPGYGAGRPALRVVRGHDAAAGGASYRREPAEQPRGESGDAVSAVSSACAPFTREVDFVVSVEDTGRDADVFDIQVEGTHCFFANGVLVHNCLIIDDIVKGAAEASSQAIRDQLWDWFAKVAMTRRMGKKRVIVVMTRWHSDDIVGRITDPENPHYSHLEAKKWKIINLPAIAEDNDPLGRVPGEPLWPDGPDRYDLDFLQSQQRLDPLGFSALYQQRPSAADGVLFRREHVKWYAPENLPPNLRVYAASDHAVSEKERRDWTVLLTAGIDAQSNLYLLDCYWERAAPDKVVEAMLTTAALRSPLFWWAGRDHITKSIGPFLRKRMMETQVFFNLIEVSPAGDKATRAQSIAARMALGLVYFPKGKPWAEKAVEELMRFPNGTHDDFVDAFALFGLGLQSQFAAAAPRQDRKEPKTGTFGWIKAADKKQRELEAFSMRGGW